MSDVKELNDEDLEQVNGGYSVGDDGVICASQGDVFSIPVGLRRLMLTQDFDSSKDTFVYFTQVYPESGTCRFGDHMPYESFFVTLNAQYYGHID